MFLSLCIGTGHAALLRGDRADLRRRPRAARRAREGRARDARGLGAPVRALLRCARRCSGSTSTTSSGRRRALAARWAMSSAECPRRPSCLPHAGPMRLARARAVALARAHGVRARSGRGRELFRDADGRVPAWVGARVHGAVHRRARRAGRARAGPSAVARACWSARSSSACDREWLRGGRVARGRGALLGPRGRARLVRLRAARGRRARRDGTLVGLRLGRARASAGRAA